MSSESRLKTKTSVSVVCVKTCDLAEPLVHREVVLGEEALWQVLRRAHHLMLLSLGQAQALVVHCWFECQVVVLCI